MSSFSAYVRAKQPLELGSMLSLVLRVSYVWLCSGFLENRSGMGGEASSPISGPFSHFLWESALQLSV